MHRRSAELGPTISAKLVAHPDLPRPKRFLLGVRATRRTGGHLHLWFSAAGAADLRLVEAWNTGGAQRLRRDELWKHTCCEAFIRTSKGYYELNFAPNGDWAAYKFAAYRDGRSLPEIAPPVVDAHRHGDHWQLQAHLDLSALTELNDGEPWTLGISAVMERKDGGISYWALTHPSGKPDFHHPDSFALILPPPEPA